MTREEREELGKLVRNVWIAFCVATFHVDKASHLTPWDELDDWTKEADRAIGEAVAEHATEQLRADLAAARAENERLIAAQSKADESEPEESPVCPQCGYSWERDGFSHAPDCPRQRALGLAAKSEEGK